MTVQEIQNVLEQTGFPVAYDVFPTEETPQLPFIVYSSLYSNNTAGDNVVYKAIDHIEVVLYTQGKDPQAEEKVENVLNFTFWTKTEDYFDDEKLTQIVYEFETIRG